MRLERISVLFLAILLAANSAVHANETRLLWGDTHLHTSFSFDAYTLGNATADPDTAYRFAKGLPVVHPGHRARVQIDRPLDFLVVTDHAEGLGAMAELAAGNPLLVDNEFGKRWKQMLAETRPDAVAPSSVRSTASSPLSTVSPVEPA